MWTPYTQPRRAPSLPTARRTRNTSAATTPPATRRSTRRRGAAGAHVVVTDVDGAAACAVADSIVKQRGDGRAVGVPLDVTREEDVREAFARTALAYGGLDLLISNAGIAIPAAVHEMTLA